MPARRHRGDGDERGWPPTRCRDEAGPIRGGPIRLALRPGRGLRPLEFALGARPGVTRLQGGPRAGGHDLRLPRRSSRRPQGILVGRAERDRRAPSPLAPGRAAPSTGRTTPRITARRQMAQRPRFQYRRPDGSRAPPEHVLVEGRDEPLGGAGLGRRGYGRRGDGQRAGDILDGVVGRAGVGCEDRAGARRTVAGRRGAQDDGGGEIGGCLAVDETGIGGGEGRHGAAVGDGQAVGGDGQEGRIDREPARAGRGEEGAQGGENVGDGVGRRARREGGGGEGRRERAVRADRALPA